jgi:transposase-like protein
MIDPGFPTTLPEFQARFDDEAACLAYLRAQKWPEGFRCPRCPSSSSYTIATRQLEECAACGHQTSLTAGTMFHGTRKPLSMWFRVIFEFVSRKHGCNAMDIQRLFGFGRKIAWAWLHKIRDAMVSPDRSKPKGRVEADETCVGAAEAGVYGRDRGERKHLIAGAVEETADGRCGHSRLAPVPSASAEDLQTFLSEVVEEGSVVHTDGLKSYEGLEHAFEHEVDVIGKDPTRAGSIFPRVHRLFSLFQGVLLSTYQGSVSAKYMSAYCNEFDFRFDRRDSGSRTHLLQRVMETAVRCRARVHRFVRARRLAEVQAS